MKKFKNYWNSEQGNEPINKTMLIGCAVILALAVISFWRWQIDSAPETAKDAMTDAVREGMRGGS